MKPTYRIQWFCPKCDKTHETIGNLIPKPQLHCGDCLVNHVEFVQMKVLAAEQMPDKPMINLKIVDPSGKEIEE